MTQLARTRVSLAGWPGAPGVNTLYWSPGTLIGGWDGTVMEVVHEELSDCLTLMSDVLVPGMTWTIELEVGIIDSATGDLVDVVTQDGTAFTGTGSGADAKTSRDTQVTMAMPTDVFLNGRRLQGRIFWGPVTGSALDTSGDVNSTVRAVWPGYWTSMHSGTGARLAIWHRPTAAAPSSGSYGDVTAVIPRRTPGTLRSRKT